MKSERRHELEHNSLDTELVNIWTWLKKNFNRILTVVLVVLIILVGWLWYQRQQDSKIIEAQNTLDNLTQQASVAKPEDRAKIIAGLKALADDNKVEWVSAKALLMLGTIQADLAINAEGIDSKDQAIAAAEGHYQRVISTYSQYPNYVAAARVGLGKLAEDKGDFDKAKSFYQAVVDDPRAKGFAVYTIAREALNTVDAYKGRVRLATTRPAWAEQPESQPASAPAGDAAEKTTEKTE